MTETPVPTPKEVARAHTRADTDSHYDSLHHTLGVKHDQASPGDHIHDGKNSKRLTDLTANTAAVAAFQSAWTAWSPIITTGGTAITLNNGTLDCTYKQIGKLTFVRVKLVVGSTTVLPAGTLLVPLPFNCVLSNSIAGSGIMAAPVRTLTVRNSTVTDVGVIDCATNTVGTVASLGLIAGSVLTLNFDYESI